MTSYLGPFQSVEKFKSTVITQSNTLSVMSSSPPKPLLPDHIPISSHSELLPNRAYYLLHHKSTTSILDLTPHISVLYSPTDGLSLLAASNLATSSGEPFPPVMYTLKKENLLGTHFTTKDDKGIEVAEWKSPVLSLRKGETRITFLHPDEHHFLSTQPGTMTPIVEDVRSEDKERREVAGEMVQVKPAGMGRRAEEFTKDSSRYIWEVEKRQHENKDLYKVIHAESPTPSKILIASFAQPVSHAKDGLLVLDSREIDPLTGILTLCAMLETKIAEGDDDLPPFVQRVFPFVQRSPLEFL